MWCIWTAVFLDESANMPVDDVRILDRARFDPDRLRLVSGLFLLAAAAQLSFASDNRSTKLRIAMLAQQVLFTGWMVYFWLIYEAEEMLLVLLGVLRRALDGDGRADDRRVGSAVAAGQAAAAAERAGQGVSDVVQSGFRDGLRFCGGQPGRRDAADVPGDALRPRPGGMSFRYAQQIVLFGVLLCGYLAAYLGVGRLIALWLRRVPVFRPAAAGSDPRASAGPGSGSAAAVSGLAVRVRRVRGLLGPAGAQLGLDADRDVDGNILADPAVPILVVSAGIVVFFANLLVGREEVEQVREAVPQRVVEDDMALHPERLSRAKKPADPFDE